MKTLHSRSNLRFLLLTFCMALGLFLFLQCVQTFYNFYHHSAYATHEHFVQQQHEPQQPVTPGLSVEEQELEHAREVEQEREREHESDVNVLDSRELKKFDYNECNNGGGGGGDSNGGCEGNGDSNVGGDGDSMVVVIGGGGGDQPLAEPETEATPRNRELKDALKCNDRPLKMETIQYGQYWLIRNLIRGTLSTNMGCAESITYTTNGDYTFFESLPTVVKRWLGPVSFALYAPGFDINGTMNSIQYVRNCLPESELIRQFVSFHVFFPATHMSALLPHNEKLALNWPYNCDGQVPYLNVPHNALYKTQKNLTYPINVGRNIARKAVNTYFIFACDIELFPSLGLIEQFLDLVWHNRSAILYGADQKPRVFPMPVFEVYENVTVPHTKPELLELLHKKLAIPFHSKLCSNCHLVPNQTLWHKYNDTDEMVILNVGKRLNAQKYWEPFYISDNREPLFDERVTWEGQKNKRIQGFAMCLLDYEYHILHPAFLVHTPGIKRFQKNSPRLKYVPPMNKLIKDVIVPEYRVLYGKNKNCVP